MIQKKISTMERMLIPVKAPKSPPRFEIKSISVILSVLSYSSIYKKMIKKSSPVSKLNILAFVIVFGAS